MPFVAGKGVDEFLELLKSGQPLPPDPNVAGIQAEGREEFVERMRKLKARYEAQFLDRKNWEVRSARTDVDCAHISQDEFCK